MQRIYLDNAASTPMDPEVLTAMTPLLLATGNPSSTHAHGREVRSAIETARKGIAKCLGALPSEIYFTSGGTESDNTAIFGAITAYNITHIISTTIEHHAVTHPIEHLEKEGLKVTWLSLDALGHIDLAELEQTLATNERSLVCLMHGNNEIGTLLDMKAVGEICKAHNALFFCDTVQTVGHLPINLAETQVHFISGAAHKFYGPKGVGFLFVRKGLHIPSLVQGGAQERSMRAGTENPAGIVGMAFALEKCCAHLPEKTKKLRELKEYAIAKLQAHIPNIAFNGDLSAEKSNPTVLNVALPIPADDMLLSGMLVFRMDLEGISCSAGSACSSGANEGSHVLNSLGLGAARAKNSLRLSFSHNNTFEELDFCIEKLRTIVSEPIPA